jgi:UMF1 family MFS transporter
MMLVNVDRGRSDGAALAKTLEELSAQGVEEEEDDDENDVDDDDNLSQATRDDLRGSFSYQRS